MTSKVRKAIVRRIEPDTFEKSTVREGKIGFYENMKYLWGTEVDVEPVDNDEGWYRQDVWKLHENWLYFLPKRVYTVTFVRRNPNMTDFYKAYSKEEAIEKFHKDFPSLEYRIIEISDSNDSK